MLQVSLNLLRSYFRFSLGRADSPFNLLTISVLSFSHCPVESYSLQGQLVHSKIQIVGYQIRSTPCYCPLWYWNGQSNFHFALKFQWISQKKTIIVFLCTGKWTDDFFSVISMPPSQNPFCIVCSPQYQSTWQSENIVQSDSLISTPLSIYCFRGIISSLPKTILVFFYNMDKGIDSFLLYSMTPDRYPLKKTKPVRVRPPPRKKKHFPGLENPRTPVSLARGFF
jgi:hypothetical protein